MCYCITVAIGNGLRPSLANELPPGILLDRQENDSISEYLPEGSECFMITIGDGDHRCSCQLYTPRLASGTERGDRIEQRRRKYRKKGWSEPKIGRAIKSAQAEIKMQESDAFAGIRFDIRGAILRLARGHHKVFVLVHWYTGSWDTEKFKVCRSVVTSSEFEEHNYVLPEDALVEVIHL